MGTFFYDKHGNMIGWIDLEGLHLWCEACARFVILDAHFGHDHVEQKEMEMVKV